MFSGPIPFYHETVNEIILATMCLHNFLLLQSEINREKKYCPLNFIDKENDASVSSGNGRLEAANENLLTLNVENNEDLTNESYNIRESLTAYFLTPAGEVTWQYDYVRRGKHQDA